MEGQVLQQGPQRSTAVGISPAGGVLLVLAGTWVLTQVLKGDALKRLGIIGSTNANDIPDPLDPGAAPTTPGPHDAKGRPL